MVDPPRDPPTVAPEARLEVLPLELVPETDVEPAAILLKVTSA